MNEKMKKDNEGMEEPKEPKMDGEPKKDEPKDEKSDKKEFFLIRGAKAAGRGLKKAGHAVNEFVHAHPYVTAGITTGIGYVIKIGVDLLNGNSEEVSSETPLPELPEASNDDVDLEDDLIEIELPEIETTEE